jgi:hypothetical protein
MQRVSVPLPNIKEITLPKDLTRALILAQVMAVAWWLVALWLRPQEIIPIWYDQEHIFLRSAAFISDPYEVYGFINPPWTAVVMLPLSWLPVPLAILLQLSIYFAALVIVIFKFGQNARKGRCFQAVVITLTSFIALDNALELNIDWVTAVALALPLAWSGPLMLIKPQNAMGYYVGFHPRRWIPVFIVTGVFLLISFVAWGWWPPQMIEAAQTNLVGQEWNLAPMFVTAWWISIPVGLVLMWLAFRRRDPLLGILAWLFFIPYIKLYGLLLPLALLAIRYRLVAIIIMVVMWIIYGSLPILYILNN